MIQKGAQPNAILSYGMVGGGEGAFIGGVHRKSISLDGKSRLVAGCFSRDFENAKRTGELLHVPRDRVYKTFQEMAAAEAARPDGIDFVVVVTPNATHYAVCKAFLEAGINVVCDKPLVFEIAEAESLKALAEAKDLLFCVTYSYTGHVTAKEARALVKKGVIGDIRVVMGEYPQGWLAGTAEGKQAGWRVDPEFAGISNAMGDIGSHIENMAAFITGLRIKRLLAKLDVIVPGRVLDDNGVVLIEYENGASGMYWASQVAIGSDNALRLRVYGSRGSLEWDQEYPEDLFVMLEDGIRRRYRRGYGMLDHSAAKYGRIPTGHPEGYFCALGNIYANFASCLIKKANGTLTPDDIEYPDANAGLDGVKFINKVVESSKKGNVWIEF